MHEHAYSTETGATFSICFLGPFLKFDSDRGIYVHVFTARPVPAGMTVIATPARLPLSPEQYPFNPNAMPFIPKTVEQPKASAQTPLSMTDEAPAEDSAPPAVVTSAPHIDTAEQDLARTPFQSSQSTLLRSASGPPPSPIPPTSPQQTPCFMYWSAKFPEGRMVPMRQPQPPVYFQAPSSELANDEIHVDEADVEKSNFKK